MSTVQLQPEGGGMAAGEQPICDTTGELIRYFAEWISVTLP
jgi:hypothetical protein